jgi:hypothetical protein
VFGKFLDDEKIHGVGIFRSVVISFFSKNSTNFS